MWAMVTVAVALVAELGNVVVFHKPSTTDIGLCHDNHPKCSGFS